MANLQNPEFASESRNMKRRATSPVQLDMDSPSMTVRQIDLSEVTTLTGHKGPVTQLVTTPEVPHLLISSSKDGSLIMWKQIRRLESFEGWNWTWMQKEEWLICESSGEGHSKAITDLSVMGTKCVSSSLDNSVCVWDMESCRYDYKRWNLHELGITSAALTKDGNVVVTGSRDRSIKYFDLRTSKCLKTFENAHADYVASVRTNPVINNQVILSCGDTTIQLWDISKRRRFETEMVLNMDAESTDNSGCYKTVEYCDSSKGLHMVSCAEQLVTLWKFDESGCSAQSTKHVQFDSKLTCAKLSPGLDFIAIAQGCEVVIWNVEKNQKVSQLFNDPPDLENPKAKATSLAWSTDTEDEDGLYLYVGRKDGSIDVLYVLKLE